MSLKFRYASFLLLVLALLVLFGAAAVHFLNKGNYLVTGALLVTLYLVTYHLGKRFSQIFLTLSFLKYLKQHDGTLSLDGYRAFIHKCLAGRRSASEKERHTRDILETLEGEGIIAVQDATIILLAC